MQSILKKLEEALGRRVLLIACGTIEVNLIEAIYDALTPSGRGAPLAVLFFCQGGYVTAARRVAMLLRDFAPHLTFLAPSHCDSAGTITALCADELLYTPLTIFSPVDPSLTGGTSDEPNQSISVQDLRLLPQAIEAWFGMDTRIARERAFDLVSAAMFPAAITSFYRAAQETAAICTELLAMRADPGTAESRDAIAQHLIYGFGSHTYPLTGGDLQALGLPARLARELEEPARSAGRLLRNVLGPSAPASGDRWIDALIGTADGIQARHRSTSSRPRLSWEAFSE